MLTQQNKLPSRGHVAIVGLLAAVFVGLGALDLPHTLALLQSHSVATARVVDFRTMTNRRQTSHDVRYVFSPNEGAPEIGRSDFLGRSNLWASLPEPVWKNAVATRLLTVRYDPSRPTNNAPDASLPSLWDSIAPMGLGLVLGIVVARFEYLRKMQSAP
jgi:hypothetical protein